MLSNRFSSKLTFNVGEELELPFFMADVMRAIKNKEIFLTSSQNIVRNYLGSADFHQLIEKTLLTTKINLAMDCYSKAQVDKFKILNSLKDELFFRYQLQEGATGINATGHKLNYYSLNYLAQNFEYVASKDSLTSILTEAKLTSFT